jgi:hypothetical protein
VAPWHRGRDAETPSAPLRGWGGFKFSAMPRHRRVAAVFSWIQLWPTAGLFLGQTLSRFALSSTPSLGEFVGPPFVRVVAVTRNTRSCRAAACGRGCRQRGQRVANR